jgi:hypothetical protein
MDYDALWKTTDLDVLFEIGDGRKIAFDKKAVFLNSVQRLVDNLKVEIAYAPSLLKVIGIKINIHGCRMTADSNFKFRDTVYNMDQVSKALGFNKTGTATVASVPTPTRIGRIFAEETVTYLANHPTVDPSLYQSSTRVEGLPRQLHFLNACYVPDLSLENKQGLMKLAKNFDMQVYKEGYVFESGFFIRMFVVFNGSVNVNSLKILVKNAFKMELEGSFDEEVEVDFLNEYGFNNAIKVASKLNKKGKG